MTAVKAKDRRELNMTEGPFLGKLIRFTIPVILTGLLQTFYNAADLAVVGSFRGELALAAVGCTGSLTNVTVGLFMGLSVGAGVVVAHHLGAGERNRVEKIVHSSLLLSAILGLIVGVFGFFMAETLLRLIGTPENVLPLATRYLQIVFMGVPGNMVYNYAAAMVRSTGDTKHPLLFLSVSGLANVLLNVLFVAVFGLGVEGVAIATITSQYLSAAMILSFMARSEGVIHFSPRKLRLDGSSVRRVLVIGVPSGIQSSLFSLANTMIQSAVNSFGDVAVAGYSAAGNLEGFVYVAMNSVYQTAMTFTGQNVGAKKYRNLKRIALLCIAAATIVGLLMGCVILLFSEFFIGLYAPNNAEVLAYAKTRLSLILPTYFLCGVMEVLAGVLRGMGKSVFTMVNSLVGACAFRILWVKTIFFLVPRDLIWIYLSWPISWVIVILANLVCLTAFYRRLTHPKKNYYSRLL